MQARYERNLGALTEAECALLHEKRACIVGCGGLGGHVIELLARIGVGALRVVDGDVFDETNLNRQLLSTEALIGASKAEAAAARVSAINSGVKVEAIATRLCPENAENLLSGCNIAIDALDNIPARRALAKACAALSIPLVHGAIGAWRAEITVIRPGGNAFDILYPPGAEAPALGAPSFTPALAASIEAAEAVKTLLGREPSLMGKLLLVDMLNESYDIVKL